MHLLVLGAFRHEGEFDDDTWKTSQCTFWCLVLSDNDPMLFKHKETGVSQCTFWCLVLSDYEWEAS